MRTPLRSAALVIVVALALTGCSTLIPVADDTEPTSSESSSESSSSEESSTDIDAAPVTGETISGTGYTVIAPEGWVATPMSTGGYTADVFVANTQDSDGFADNFNVLLSPAGTVTPDQVESLGIVELETAGATDVTVHDRVTIAGSESSHLSASMAAQGVSYAVEQYYVSSDDQTYVVTFSFSPTVTEADRVALAESVLVTWEWS